MSADGGDGLRAGARAVLHGLQARPELNDTHCVLVEWMPERERWQVRADDVGGELLSVRPANLTSAGDDGASAAEARDDAELVQRAERLLRTASSGAQANVEVAAALAAAVDGCITRGEDVLRLLLAAMRQLGLVEQLLERLTPFSLARLVSMPCGDRSELVHSLATIQSAAIASRGGAEIAERLRALVCDGLVMQAMADAHAAGALSPEADRALHAAFISSQRAPFAQYSSTYSLAELRAVREQTRAGHHYVRVPPHLPHALPSVCVVMEGVFVDTRVQPPSGLLKKAILHNPGPQLGDRRAQEALEDDDWTELEELAVRAAARPEPREAVRAWRRAREAAHAALYRGAARGVPAIRAACEAAKRLSPEDMLSRLHLAEMAVASSPDLLSPSMEDPQLEAGLQLAREAEEAGLRVLALTAADAGPHAHDLHNWLPGRDLLRATLLRGALEAMLGRPDEAAATYRRCLGLDHGDHLGARVRLLHLTLRQGHGPGSEPLRSILRAKYGADGARDTLLCAFTFTRALDEHAREHSPSAVSSKADALLDEAIGLNPFVPLQLLGWEVSGPCGHEPGVPLWSRLEAAYYVRECSQLWEGEPLAWLERRLRARWRARPRGDGMPHADGWRAFTRGTRMRNVARADAAIEHLVEAERLFPPGSAAREQSTMCLASAHYEDSDFRACCSAVRRLLRAQPNHRAARLLHAEALEALNDVAGAREQYTYVLEHIDSDNNLALRSLSRLGAAPLPRRAATAAPTRSDENRRQEEAVARGIAASMPGRAQGMRPTSSVAGASCCAQCGRQGVKLRACARCREQVDAGGSRSNAALYCSTECQRAHWPEHKRTCSGRRT